MAITAQKNGNDEFTLSISQFVVDKNDLLIEIKPRMENISIEKLNRSLIFLQSQLISITNKISEINAKIAACQAVKD